MNNLEIIIDNLDEKELLPKVEKIVEKIKEDYEQIKSQVINHELEYIDEVTLSRALDGRVEL